MKSQHGSKIYAARRALETATATVVKGIRLSVFSLSLSLLKGDGENVFRVGVLKKITLTVTVMVHTRPLLWASAFWQVTLTVTVMIHTRPLLWASAFWHINEHGLSKVAVYACMHQLCVLAWFPFFKWRL